MRCVLIWQYKNAQRMTSKSFLCIPSEFKVYFCDTVKCCIGRKVAPQLALSPAMTTARPLTVIDKLLEIAVTIVWHLGQ